MSATQVSTEIPTGTWNRDPVHSDIGFAVTYSGAGTFRGTFDQVETKLENGLIEGIAQVASVRVDDPNLAGHLQSPDFFDAEQNPELGDAVTIQGDLTLRGETKSVTITGTVTGPTGDPFGNQRIAFDVETTVDRRDFGIVWNTDLPSGGPALGNDVKITANLAFVQA